MKQYPFQTKDKAKWSEAHSLAINSLLQMRPSVHSYVGGGQCLVYRRDSGTPEPLLINKSETLKDATEVKFEQYKFILSIQNFRNKFSGLQGLIHIIKLH